MRGQPLGWQEHRRDVAWRSVAVWIFSLLPAIAFGPGDAQCARNGYEAYYVDLGSYPRGPVSWGEDQLEVQGITNDGANWYITSTDRTGIIDSDIDNCFLWKIPKLEDLGEDVFTNPNVTYKTLYDFPPLWNGSDPLRGYIHWGDLDHYKYAVDDEHSIDYLIVPMTSPSRVAGSLVFAPAVTVLRASDLSLVGYGRLPGGNGTGQDDVGWCAVNPRTGYLYSSNDRTTQLFRYKIPWDTFPATGYFGVFSVTREDTYSFLNEGGTAALDLHNMQGGEFSSTADLLYISNGGGRCHGQGRPDPGDPFDGIHAFDTANWREIKRSINTCYEAPGVSDCGHPVTDTFDLTYDFGCGVFETHSEQPEGLTIWDLDGAAVPGISGQLHVLVASVGLVGNQAWLEHFSGRLHVNRASGSSCGGWSKPFSGTEERPFSGVVDAFECYPAWDGVEMVLQGGSYPETGRFATRVRLRARGGVATIGR